MWETYNVRGCRSQETTNLHQWSLNRVTVQKIYFILPFIVKSSEDEKTWVLDPLQLITPSIRFKKSHLFSSDITFPHSTLVFKICHSRDYYYWQLNYTTCMQCMFYKAQSVKNPGFIFFIYCSEGGDSWVEGEHQWNVHACSYGIFKHFESLSIKWANKYITTLHDLCPRLKRYHSESTSPTSRLRHDYEKVSGFIFSIISLVFSLN